MSEYKRVIAAVDLSAESEVVVRRAVQVAGDAGEAHIVFVQEPMDSVYMGVVPYGPVFMGLDEVEQKLREELTARMRKLGEKHGIPESRQHMLDGNAAPEIRRFAEENGVDLVVLGTHGQKGVQLLLGSTANSVLHGVCCDVLAVRIRAD